MNGHHCAVIQGSQRVTYAQVWAEIKTVAELLKNKGVNPGDSVALLMANSAMYIAAYYAVWYVGGYVVALNTTLKAKELANLIAHCDTKVVLHDTEVKEASTLSYLLEKRVQLIELQFGCNNETTEKQNGIFSQNSPDNQALAAVIYTSGTTGQPKGVMLSHLNIQSNTETIINYLSLGSDDKIMCVLPFFYSYGNSVMHTHLSVGATLVLENSFLYPQKTLQVMEKEEVTGFSGVPSTFALLLTRTKIENFNFHKLRYVTQAGGAMSANDIDRFRSTLEHVQFYVMYGQTEATARLTYLEPVKIDEKRGSVGKAILSVSLKIVDDQDREVDTGEIGEVYARGDNVMLGYYRNPEGTEKTIVNGWLKTGDRGRLDNEGYLFLVGRNREMIKSGAHRIAPAEIEEVLCEHSMIKEAAIVGEDDELLGQVIKAFIVPKKWGELEKRDVLRFSKERLSQYKIPKNIEFIESLPKTTSGKVKKYLLNH